jgi:hypothetical protein
MTDLRELAEQLYDELYYDVTLIQENSSDLTSQSDLESDSGDSTSQSDLESDSEDSTLIPENPNTQHIVVMGPNVTLSHEIPFVVVMGPNITLPEDMPFVVVMGPNVTPPRITQPVITVPPIQRRETNMTIRDINFMNNIRRLHLGYNDRIQDVSFMNSIRILGDDSETDQHEPRDGRLKM